MRIPVEQTREAIARGDGTGIHIAVLDSGVEIAHPEFAGKKLLCDRVSEDGRFNNGSGGDLYGHGTAIAGIIWDLAPRAEIGSFGVLGPNLKSRTTLVSAAATDAIERGFHILNCSFACSIPGHVGIFKTWIDQAWKAGVHVVAASGSHQEPEWPAHFTSVLGVDATRDNSPHPIHPLRDGLIEFAVPGSNCRVAWKDGGHRVMSGSSFAAAHLTGLLARLLSVYPDLDPLEAKASLRELAAMGAK